MNEKDKKTKNPHDGHRERVRNRFLATGLDGFEEHQLLELILFYTQPRGDTNELAHKILKKFGSLENLLTTDSRIIAKECNINIKTAILIALFIPTYHMYTKSALRKMNNITNSRMAGETAIALLHGREREQFYLICLDSRRRLLSTELLGEGTELEITFDMRKAFETLLRYKTKYVVIAHNHPSGALAFSENDVKATTAIANALSNIDVELLDHIIVAGNDYLSFAEKRMLGLTWGNDKNASEKAKAFIEDIRLDNIQRPLEVHPEYDGEYINRDDESEG